ncbi:MAG: DUF1592 domain-containing protein [Deltaproteobacteria bacterium]|nr:DUF1592 domain-containing protein [Deltaproteobacteria bacterium]
MKFHQRFGWVLSLAAATTGCSGTIVGISGNDGLAGGGGNGTGGKGTGNSTVEPGPNGTPLLPATCATPDKIIAGPAPLVRLSNTEYRNTIRDLFPKMTTSSLSLSQAGEVETDGFLNTAIKQNTSAELIDFMQGNAETVAKAAIADLSKLLPCAPANAAAEPACGTMFIATFGKQAFRRPLSAAETTKFGTFFTDARTKWGFPVAIRMVVEAFLQSPSFLYRIEAGGTPIANTSAIPLDGHAIASRLSYFLLDTMPDAKLMEAADAGRLTSADGLEAETRRLLADPRAREAVASFHSQWLRFSKMENLVKAKDLFPNFTPSMAAAMKESTVKYVDHVFFEEGHSVRALLVDDHAFVNNTLSPLYGDDLRSTGNVGAELAWQQVDAQHRSGILTQAGLLAGFAHERNDAPVLRGIFVLDRLLCTSPPPPPTDVNTTLPELTATSKQTTRQQLEMSHSSPMCASCHSAIDGIGFGLGHFDALGRYRDQEFGLPVDASGELVSTDVDGKFDGAVELGKKLANSGQVHDCVTRQWLSYSLAVPRAELDECMVDPLNKVLANSNGDMRELLVAVVVGNAFRHRPVAP